MSTPRFRELDASKIVATIDTLERRVAERFPDSNLRQLCVALHGIALDAWARAQVVAVPNWPLRIAVGALITALLVMLGGTLASLHLSASFSDFGSFAQAVNAGVNDIVLLGVGIFFLVSLERRIKRRRVLRALHEIRSLAHIADMHQLTKDPERILTPGPSTASSPERTMTRFELGRYLDYVAELLSLMSKVSALYVQRFDDEVVLGAVNEIESLTTGLSSKIWQKIVILEPGGRG
ncbi:MAG TPA: hypothetical protein VMT93_05075 [Gemmatimonadaceae bacterium]|nr:hypothetical protein [Gemmatimonadaceae bacterium]